MDVKKISHLARLKLTPQEEELFQKQLNSVFKYFEDLSRVNTDGVEPLVTPSEIEVFFRDDRVEASGGAEDAMANAPEKKGHLFKVPPVV